jgi:hypothetical protein
MAVVQFTDVYPDGPGTAAAGGSGGAAPPLINPEYPGMPVGATPVHKDVTVTVAGTVALWTPTVGTRFVLASAFVTTDTAMRVALVDDIDVQNQRPVNGDFGAAGGASPNLVPVPYPAKSVGNVLRLVTSANGTVRVRVSGWEVAG